MAPEPPDSDGIDYDQLADNVVRELDPGTVVDDKLVLSRRQVIALAGSGLGTGALALWASGGAAAADGTNDTSDGLVQGTGGGVDVRLDELRDPGGDEVLDIDDTGAINAAVSGRAWKFDSVNTDDATIDNIVISQNNITNITRFTGDRVTVSGGTYETIFDQSSAVDVIFGVINGTNIGNIRLTWADGSTGNLKGSELVRGRDSNDDSIAAVTLPPIKEIQKLEFRSRSITADYGYYVVTV